MTHEGTRLMAERWVKLKIDVRVADGSAFLAGPGCQYGGLWFLLAIAHFGSFSYLPRAG